MKKKHRDISVKGIKYGWTMYPDDEGSIFISIWKDKKIIHKVETDIESVTPKCIESVILEMLINE